MRITKKGDLPLRISTNRGRENHLFASRPSSSAVRQINSIHRAWQALGIIILLPARDASQRRGAATIRQEAGLGARGVTKPTTGTRTNKPQDSDPKRMNSRPGDTIVASLTDGNMDTPHIIHIHGRHSPPPRLDPTPHGTKSTLQQPYGPANMRQKSKLLAWLGRYHPLGEGHEQARSEHKEKPDNTHATATAQYTHSTLLKSSNRPMAAARRRQGQQLYAWYDTPSMRPQTAPPFPLTPHPA